MMHKQICIVLENNIIKGTELN